MLKQKIGLAVNGIDIQKDEWIAVAYPRNWFPAQFIQFDLEQEEAQVHHQVRNGLCGLNCVARNLMLLG